MTVPSVFFAILASIAIQQSSLAQASPSPLKVVDLGYAKYQTDVSLEDGVTSFLGIRYAAPPTGAFRWAAPQAPATVAGIQNATMQPRQCLQVSLTDSLGASTSNPFRKQSLHKRGTDDVSDEDCLFLNVHVPSVPKTTSPLPVIFYIHGGGYITGNISYYPIEDFVKGSNYGVISVGIQYRLGVFGFLSGQKVKDGGALNAGLLDQNFALQWVRQHIASFGGDPTRVAIWGESSGAGSVLQHMVAHGGSTQPPLFGALLMNSPYLPPQYIYNDSIPEKIYSEVVSQASCVDSTDSLDCLRTADAKLLLDASTSIGSANFLGTCTFVPVVDGTFIIERPTVTLKRGRLNGKALLVSTNSNEGTVFVPSTVLLANNFTLTQYTTQLFPRLNQKQIQTVVDLYSKLGLTEVPDLAAAVIGDSIYICPAYYMVSAFGTQGRKAEFAIPPGTHGEDLAYEVSNFGSPTFNNTAFMKAFQQAFLSTAISLDPNDHFDPTNITPYWPSWLQGHAEMLFNKTDDDKPVVQTFTTDPGLVGRCALWNSLAPTNWQ